MAYYTTDWGDQFDTYEEAREACLQHMDTCDLSEELQYSVSFYELLLWAMKQPSFFDDFADKLSAAEKEFCNEYIHEWEDDE